MEGLGLAKLLSQNDLTPMSARSLVFQGISTCRLRRAYARHVRALGIQSGAAGGVHRALGAHDRASRLNWKTLGGCVRRHRGTARSRQHRALSSHYRATRLDCETHGGCVRRHGGSTIGRKYRTLGGDLRTHRRHRHTLGRRSRAVGGHQWTLGRRLWVVGGSTILERIHRTNRRIDGRAERCLFRTVGRLNWADGDIRRSAWALGWVGGYRASRRLLGASGDLCRALSGRGRADGCRARTLGRDERTGGWAERALRGLGRADGRLNRALGRHVYRALSRLGRTGRRIDRALGGCRRALG